MTVTDTSRAELPTTDATAVQATSDPTTETPVGWDATDQAMPAVPVPTSIREAAEAVIRRIRGSYAAGSFILDMETGEGVRTARSLPHVRDLLTTTRAEMAALMDTWNLPSQSLQYRASVAAKAFGPLDPRVYEVLIAEFTRREQLNIPDPDSRVTGSHAFDKLTMPPDALIWMGLGASSGVFSGFEVLSWTGPDDTSDHLLIGWVSSTTRRRNGPLRREDPDLRLFAIARWGSGMRDWQCLVELTHQKVLVGLVAASTEKREARLRVNSATAVEVAVKASTTSPSRAERAAARRRRRIRRWVMAVCLSLAVVLTILVCAYGVPLTSFHGILGLRTLVRNPLRR
jgi:hypothetical protein